MKRSFISKFSRYFEALEVNSQAWRRKKLQAFKTHKGQYYQDEKGEKSIVLTEKIVIQTPVLQLFIWMEVLK